MKYPIIGDKIDGKFTFKIFENYKTYITKEELYKSYDKGY
jgi:hypothetical protein